MPPFTFSVAPVIQPALVAGQITPPRAAMSAGWPSRAQRDRLGQAGALRLRNVSVIRRRDENPGR